MRVNLIGAGTGSSLTDHLASLLMRAGHEAYVNAIKKDFFDVTVFCGLWHLAWHTNTMQDFYKVPTVALAVGSDVYRDLGQARDMGSYLTRVSKVLIANDAMREKVELYNKNVEFWHMPIDTEMLMSRQVWLRSRFGRRARFGNVPKRDTLLYCGSPDHQDLERILKYVVDHPGKRCTLLGRGYQDFIMEEYDNLLSIRMVPYYCMPYIYAMHNEYRLYLKREQDIIGAMNCEALYMGLKTYSNDLEITFIPRYMMPEVAMPRLIEILEDVIK